MGRPAPRGRGYHQPGGVADTPRADVSRILKQFASTNYFNLNGDVSRKAWDFTIKTLVAFKLLEKPVGYDQSVETQYARNAVKTLE